MTRKAKSQWDFGELFPPQELRRVFSVSELTGRIRRLVETEIGEVWVAGEVTNFREQNSGHIYFSLKDAMSQVGCVLFRSESGVDRNLLRDGRMVTVRGELTVYEARGVYQLRVTRLELEGVGALQAAFEKLKQKLKVQGCFAQERKRPLPRFPRRIGLVTSPTGAAIRDVLHVIQRRNPTLEIILIPCRVQGAGAALEIAAAIRLLNAFHAAELGTPGGVTLDLILITRGGGSLEDLWAFNEEPVAQAIYESALPVISAVGHEIDFTISDFVADARAATPSVAAELITEDVFSSCQHLAEVRDRLRELAAQQIDKMRQHLAHAGSGLARFHPQRKLREMLLRVDDLQTALSRCIRQGLRRHRVAWVGLAERLLRVKPAAVLRQRREALELARTGLTSQAERRFSEWKHRVQMLAGRLKLLGPEQVLARGYSITMRYDTGTIVRHAEEVEVGTLLKTRLYSGTISSRTEK